MNIKKYLSIGMTLIFTSVAMQISLFAPKKVYASVQNYYTMSTIAGTGTAGYSGDGGDATSAELNWPRKVAVDGSKNIYITDFSNNAVRKIDHETGKISTIADIKNVRDTAVDSIGDLYIVDGDNNVIKKMDHEKGTISIIAGSGVKGYTGDGDAATSAELNQPYGVVVDGSGDIYIADTYNNAIRKVDHETLKISTIANGLNKPYAVAVDSSKNLYIADTYNKAIKKVDHETNNISTISKEGTVGLAFGVAVDNLGNVYVGDSLVNSIKKIDSTTHDINTIAQVGLDNPIGVSVDASGNVYVADSRSNTIKKLSPAFSYNVTYDGNENTAGTLPIDSNNYKSGTYATAKEAWTLERTGYKFTGWNTSKDGKGLAIAEGQNFSITGDTTLYAQWEKIVPASGLTVTAAPEATPVQGKVNLTVTPGADGSNHKILYRIVTAEPTALNVGEEVEPSEGWITVTDTNTHEISVANGKYIEAVEVDWGYYKVTKWGKSEVVKDGYVKPISSSLDKTTVNFDKNPANAQDISINMELNGNKLVGIRNAADFVTSGLVEDRDYTVDGSVVTIKKSYLEQLSAAQITFAFNFSAGEPQYLKVTITDTTSKDISINPATANFDKSAANQADVNVSMGIEKYDLKNISANGGYLPDKVLQGNTLTIKKSDLGEITPVAELTFGDDKGTTRNLVMSRQVGDAGIILNMMLFDGIASGAQLTDITNEGNTLVNGTDYVLNGTQLTIKKGLLTKLGTGTVNLVLSFGKQHLVVTMSTNETEITATVTLYKNTLTSITNGIYTLVNGKDYTVSGNNVTIKKDYLSTLSTGTAALALNFSEGNPQILKVEILGENTKSYKVTFEDYDGSPIGETQIVNCGESAKAPADPKRTGYVFAGWDKNYNNITGDLVVKATYTSGTTYDFPPEPTDKPGETKIPTDYLKSRDNTLVIANPAANLSIPASAIDLVDGADHIKVTEKVVTQADGGALALFSNLPNSVTRMVGNPISLNVQLLKADDTVIENIHQFANNQKVKVTIKLTPSQIAGLDTSKLSMYYFDETSNTWVELGGSFNPITMEFTFYTPHFTSFAIMNKVSSPIPTPTVTSYTVTFKDYDGTVIGTPQAVNYGGSATAPAVQARAGYTFTGWDKTFNNVTGDLVVTAQYSINNCTVTFKDYDGKVIGEPQIVKYGEGAKAPADPTRTGYDFAGWDKTFDKVTGDLVVTATYKSGNTYDFKPTTTNNGDETKISADYFTSKDNTLVITRDNAEISIPAGAIDLADGTGYIKVTEQSEASNDVSKQYGNLPEGLRPVGSPLLISIQLFDANNNYIKNIHKLANNKKIKVTMKFTADQIKGIDSSVITMYYYDETTKAWTKLEGSFDAKAMEMTFYMTSL